MLLVFPMVLLPLILVERIKIIKEKVPVSYTHLTLPTT